jgi:leucyl aminopeptidase (aminopeptidase T)
MPATRRLSGLTRAAVDFDLANAARRVVEASLGVVGGERIAIFVDRARASLGATLAEVVTSVGATPEIMLLEDLGTRPLRTVPEPLRALLRRVQASILLIGFEYGEWSLRFEYVTLVTELNLRHAHMVGVGKSGLLAGFAVDAHRIHDATRAVRMRLREDSVLHLRSAAGSDLEVKLDGKHRWQERVGVVRPGRWENLPAGELFTAPADVNGVFVADACLGGPVGATAGALTHKPVRVEIRAGTCRAVECSDRALAKAVEDALRAEANGDRVGMVIIGTNIGLLEATGELMCDQNLPGLHLGFGATFPDQTGASWDSPTQISMTATRADVDLDGAPLLRKGRFLVL